MIDADAGIGRVEVPSRQIGRRGASEQVGDEGRQSVAVFQIALSDDLRLARIWRRRELADDDILLHAVSWAMLICDALDSCRAFRPLPP